MKGLEPAAVPARTDDVAPEAQYQQLRDELDKLSDAQFRRWRWSRGGAAGRGEAVHRRAVSFSIQAKRDTLPAVLEVRGRFSEPAGDQFEVLKRDAFPDSNNRGPNPPRSRPGFCSAS